MKKILDYLYIFSKLSTSFILLFLLFVLVYFFYQSFNNQEISNNDQTELINKLNLNVQKLSKLSDKIKLTESSIDEIKKIIQNIDNTDKSKEFVTLNKKIKELDISLKNISNNLKEIKKRNITDSDTKVSKNISPITDKTKKDLIKIIVYKFENNIDFTEELNILQNFSDNKNNHVFEKINLIRLKNFRGNKFLKEIYSKESDFYLKEKFKENFSNEFTNFLMKFVAVKPSKINTIKNNKILILKEVNILLEEKNYNKSYRKIITFEGYEIYFKETIKQIQIANDFKKLINKNI